MKRIIFASAVIFLFTAAFASADTFGTGDNQFEIEFVTISGATNPASGYGIVNHDYRMGTYEITNNQWTRFKNEYGTVYGSPTSAYDANPYWTSTNVPTNNVSWYEAAQFVNWLNTSTGHQAAYKFTGAIHTNDYTLSVWDAENADRTNLYRHKNAYYFLPTEDEWVKAAYWNGNILQTYSTINNAVPILGVDTNYGNLAGQPWDVGSGSEELNGTFDMMGNVYEWMESPWYSGYYLFDSDRGVRGGSCWDVSGALTSSGKGGLPPYGELVYLGFRVASVPEPGTVGLLAFGGLILRKKAKGKRGNFNCKL